MRRVLLGARPQTPRVGFAEGWAAHSLLRSRTTAFASFWKRRTLFNIEFLTPVSASPRVGLPIFFCEAATAFASFLEKKSITRLIELKKNILG
jgi:hypothetical protein